MFDAIGGLLDTLFGDIQSTFTTLFGIGILFCTIMAIFGDDQNQALFKKWLARIVIAFIIFLIAMPIIEYFQDNV
jgi:stage V sporulation protein AE